MVQRIALIFGFLILLVLFLCIVPISAKAKVHVDLIQMKAYYSIKILFLKLLIGTTFVENSKLVIQNTHNMVIKADKESQKKEGLFLKQVMSKTKVDKLEMYFQFGKQDAFETAIVVGTAQIIMSIISAYVLSKNIACHVAEKSFPTFNKESCEFSAKLVAGISIFQIVKSKIVANKMHKENISGKQN